MMNKALKIILIVHAIVTFLAGLVLVISPELIPKMVNVSISKNQYIICYFLAACEYAIAYLSFKTTILKDFDAIKIILISFIIFHLATAILEVLALQNGVSKVLILNIVLRIIISFLFFIFGILRLTKGK